MAEQTPQQIPQQQRQPTVSVPIAQLFKEEAFATLIEVLFNQNNELKLQNIELKEEMRAMKDDIKDIKLSLKD